MSNVKGVIEMHKIFGHNVYGEMSLIAEMDFRPGLSDEFELRFDEDNEPCSEESDRFVAGHRGAEMIFQVIHADGNSAEFLRQLDLFYYMADRLYPDAAGELPIEG